MKKQRVYAIVALYKWQYVLASMIVISVIAGGISSSHAQTIVGDSAGTQFVEGAQVRSRVTFEDEAPGSPIAVTSTFIWGPHPDFTTAFTLPWINKEPSGLGDVAIAGKYRFFRKDAKHQITQWSLLGALKVPSGRDDAKSLSPPDQVGSGSWDVSIGTAYNHVENLQLFWNWSASYTFKTEGAQDYEFGDVISYNLVGAVRPYVPPYPPTLTRPDVWMVMEMNGSTALKDQQGGDRLGNTGGTVIFMSPGIQILPRPNLLFEMAVQLPVIDELNGDQEAPDYRLVMGVRVFF